MTPVFPVDDVMDLGAADAFAAGEATVLVAVANEPSVSERIAATGQDMVPAGPDELLQTIKQQAAAAEAIAKILGLKRKN